VNDIRTREEIDAVAAYTSVDGAQRAVAHLVSLGYDERDLGIGPRDFEVVDQHPLRRRLGRWLRVGAITGTSAMAVIAIGGEVGWRALVDSVLPAVVWGAVVGMVLGIVVALVSYRRRKAVEFAPSPDLVAPTRFEVVVNHDQDRARHGLAKWWDPQARPAAWRQPA
jgi:hypothetical protein